MSGVQYMYSVSAIHDSGTSLGPVFGNKKYDFYPDSKDLQNNIE